MERKIRSLFAAGAVLSAVISFAVFIASGDMLAAIITLCGMLSMTGVMYLLHCVESSYIDEVVAKLSELIDVLTELSDKKVFNEDEDTIVSKLQSKVLRLVRILKATPHKACQKKKKVV